VSGIVKIGQTMTMVLGIKDEENKFDMIVRNCVAHDGKRTPIQLVTTATFWDPDPEPDPEGSFFKEG
jgi:hypothetical protein